jgi:hypothetical protein
MHPARQGSCAPRGTLGGSSTRHSCVSARGVGRVLACGMSAGNSSGEVACAPHACLRERNSVSERESSERGDEMHFMWRHLGLKSVFFRNRVYGGSRSMAEGKRSAVGRKSMRNPCPPGGWSGRRRDTTTTYRYYLQDLRCSDPAWDCEAKCVVVGVQTVHGAEPGQARRPL